MPEHHYLRLRAIYYDDKYCNFKAYYDYLVPEGIDMEDIQPSKEIIEVLSERCIDGEYWNADVVLYECRYYSDGFDLNDKSYYSVFIDDFKHGGERKVKSRNSLIKEIISTNAIEISPTKSFDRFVRNLQRISFIHILNASNSDIEDIGLFADKFDWNDVMDEPEFSIKNFFEVTIRFECGEYKRLCEVLELFPQEYAEQFHLDKNLIFVPEMGYLPKENKIYTLHILVYPQCMRSKYHFRLQLNQYLDKLTSCVEEYCKKNSF